MRAVRVSSVCKRREQKQHLPRLSRMSWLRCMVSWLTQGSLPPLSDDGGSAMLTAVCPAPAAKARKLYQATVDDLSSKSISIKQLLHFFHEVFKHSALPMGTTTEEVVAELIVPITGIVSMSWVDYLMSFADSRVQLIAARTAQDSTTHVVHAWKMKFEDLLGAVLSHASSDMMRNFGSCYEEACQLYSEVLDRRYFICCFCINQHHSICHEPHIQCRCSAPKYDDSMPRCEINKFASVAQRIHDRGGGMLLALDRELKTLSRAWCVDEINYSIASGMSIEVAYNTRPSGLLLRKFECDVEQCQARPADKERILAKVRDGVGIAAFNARVTDFIRESEKRLLANVRSRACGNIFPRVSTRVDALTESKPLIPSWTHCNSSSSGHIIDTLTSQTPKAEELLAGADAIGSEACQTDEEIKMEPTSSWSSASTDAPSSNTEVTEDADSLSFDSVSSHGSIDMADKTSPGSELHA